MRFEVLQAAALVSSVYVATSAAAAESKSRAPTPMETTAAAADKIGTLSPGTGIPVGQKVPDGRVLDLGGKPVTLSSLYAKGPILLAFYRGGWCPYCNFEIRALTTAFPEYQKRGLTPVAVSVEKPEEAAKTNATYSVPFPILSDGDLALIEAFHVVNKVEGKQFEMLSNYGVDLEGASGKTHHVIAIPSLFLIDQSGIVRWAHSDPTYTVRPTTAQILAAIDAAQRAGLAARR
jgi:peroxiredoxin